MTDLKKGKRGLSSIEQFFLHLHPQKIDERAVKFNRTFGLGGICALLFIVLLLTGLILKFSYIPTVKDAYDSVTGLKIHTLFGQFIRNLHHISAHLLILATFLHLIRVYYSQSFYKKRAKNWIYGLLLFFLILFSNFTGYLLPWDQLSYWAITVNVKIIEYIPFIGSAVANIVRGGETIDGNTLLNFYTIHTGVLPILIIFLMSMHFWLVRKAGGVALPLKEIKKNVKVYPDLVWKEIMLASLLLAGLFLAAIFFEAPLLDEANPMESPNPTKAPWYFLGAQELLLHLHPLFSAGIIPLSVGFFFFYLPYFKINNPNEGVWFSSPNGKKIVIQSAIASFVFTFLLIYLLEHYLHFDLWVAEWPGWIVSGIIPLFLYMIPVSGYLYAWYKKEKAIHTELLMASTTILLTSYVTMVFVALLLRGKGMLLIF